MTGKCASCGEEFPPRQKNQRFCSATCRQRGRRGHLASVGAEAQEPGPTGDGVAASTRARLVEVGRLDTPLAQTAMVLARRIDAGQDTGSGLAALARQHQASLEAATANLTVAADPVERLRLVVGERRGGSG